MLLAIHHITDPVGQAVVQKFFEDNPPKSSQLQSTVLCFRIQNAFDKSEQKYTFALHLLSPSLSR